LSGFHDVLLIERGVGIDGQGRLILRYTWEFFPRSFNYTPRIPQVNMNCGVFLSALNRTAALRHNRSPALSRAAGAMH
jgi:hypothetical protein